MYSYSGNMIMAEPKNRRSMRNFASETSALAVIETAFALPFLLFVGLAGVELANYTITHTRISQVALSLADNASRLGAEAGSGFGSPQVREVDINDALLGADLQAGPSIDLKNRGRIILSSLERNSRGGQYIHWQRCYGARTDYDSSYGRQYQGMYNTRFPGMGPTGQEVKAPEGTSVMFVEIAYQYRPIIYPKWLGAKKMRYTAAFITRDARDLAGANNYGTYNPSNAYVAYCNGNDSNFPINDAAAG